MKKVLFATTALVASAGIASAQGVSVSGFAEMGIVGGSAIETQFHTDIDVTFEMSGETDNGLTFGASVDLDEAENIGSDSGSNGDFVDLVISTEDEEFVVTGGSDNNADNDGFAVFISGNFGTLTMGDTDGAFDWALTEVAMGGAIADNHTGHAGYNGNAGLDSEYDGQIVRYNYSFGDFAFAVSAEIDDVGDGDAVFGIGGRYSGDLGGVTLGVGLGYQSSPDHDILGISISANMDNGLNAVLNYSDLDGIGDNESHMGIGLGYSMDALTVAMNYGVYDSTVSADDEGFGVAVNYDLGGGAVVQFGYGSGSTAGAADANTWSLGVAMSF